MNRKRRNTEGLAMIIRFPHSYLLTEERIAKWQGLHPGIRISRREFDLLVIEEHTWPFSDLEYIPLELPMEDSLHIEQSMDLIALNASVRVEISQRRKLRVYLPDSQQESEFLAGITSQFFQWAKERRFGRCYSSAISYLLPDENDKGINRISSASVSYISYLKATEGTQKVWADSFFSTSPDIVVEIVNRAGSLKPTLHKITTEWMPHGVMLALVIDTANGKIHTFERSADHHAVMSIAKSFTHPLLADFDGDFTYTSLST